MTHLHTHTVYSRYDGVSTCQEMVDQAVLHGHKALAITNHGLDSMGDLFQFQLYAKEKGVKPILGNEAYLVEELVTTENKKRKRTHYNHIILLAKNSEGWKNLCHLSYISNIDEEHYYYKPRITFEELFQYKEGLVVGSACLASVFAQCIVKDDYDKAEYWFKRFVDELGENFYAEVQLNELVENQKKYNDWIISTAAKYNVPVILTGDIHYATPEGALTQRFVFNLRKEEDSEGDDTYKCHSLYYQGVDDFKKFNKEWNYGYSDSQIEEWCANSDKIAEKCNYEIPLGTGMKLPRVCFDEEKEFSERAKAGLAKHFNCEYKDCPEEYKKQLEHEIEVLLKKGAYRYMLTVSSIIQHSHELGYMTGPSRGSCFLPGTKVQGKEIQDYKIGDKILTGLLREETKVEDIYIFDKDEKIQKIITEENEEIKCTSDHKFLALEKGLKKERENFRFIKAEFLNPGDFLIRYTSQEIEFAEIKEIKQEKYQGKVYDLRVSSLDHTYTVTDKDYIVHNCGGSLCALCLGIASWAIDPLKNGLIFERFVSEDRLVSNTYKYFKGNYYITQNHNYKFSDLKKIVAKKIKEYPEYKERALYELRRAGWLEKEFSVYDEIMEVECDDRYVLPFFLGKTEKVDLSKPLEVVQIREGDSGGLDIDLDLHPIYKEINKKWLIDKYGSEKVMGVGTYTSVGLASGIKDILRKCDVSFKESNDFCKELNDELSFEENMKNYKENFPILYETYERNKAYLDFTPKIMNGIKNCGQHAGGVLILDEPVWNYIPVIHTKDGVASAMVESGNATECDLIGLTKIDCLAITILDVLDKAVEAVNEKLFKIIDDDGIEKIVPESYIKNA